MKLIIALIIITVVYIFIMALLNVGDDDNDK